MPSSRSTTVVITGARILTCAGPPADPLGIIDRGALICDGDRIAWVGRESDLPALDSTSDLLDLGGRLLTPGLIDCHTHLPFAGDRAREFGLRSRGASYAEIAAAGGGIASTVAATRAASDDDLGALAVGRLRRALAAGTTTLEAKSGYDLTIDGELRLLAVIRSTASRTPVRLEPTLLAHVVPAEARASDADRAAYVDAFADLLVPAAAARRLATSVDVYCDDGAYTLDETRRILTAARSAGLAIRGHIGQFADLGGAELLAGMGALSVDHLEQVSAAGIAALAAAGTVAVMLPGACVQLRMAPPPVDRLRAAGVALAVATDLNPGTSHGETLPVQMWLAATHYGMTVDETWLGVTRVAARALGRSDVGVIARGARADLVSWNTDEPAAVPYRYTANLVRSVHVAGVEVAGPPD
jgi:imidazolonepropionase